MIAYIIDSIQYQKPFINVLIFVVSVFVSVSTISVFGDYINHRTRPKANEKINRRIRMELYEKAAEIDLECYDNPEFYNDFIWAMNNATDRVNAVIWQQAENMRRCSIFRLKNTGISIAELNIMSPLRHKSGVLCEFYCKSS